MCPFTLNHLTKRRIYAAIALTMTILIWKIPSFLGNAFCTALVGFVLGREWIVRVFADNVEAETYHFSI